MTKVGIPFAKWQDPGDWDAIVIGSGIGGLAAASLLGTHGGKKVLVLERHTTAGGFTHTFSRDRWEWDVGVHYIGQVHHEGAMLRRLFDEVTGGELEWEPMGEVYDTVVIGGRRWDYVAGRENWRQRMHEYFPGEEAAIDRWLELVSEATRGARSFFAEKAMPVLPSLLAGPWMRRGFLRHSDRTLGEVLDELTDDPTLKAVLAAQFGDHGLPPAQASFAIHAMIFNHYLGGAAYPVGGSARIAETMAPVIENASGAIVIGADVASVIVEGGRAVGVRMAKGAEIRAPLVLSDAGVPNTVHRLLPEGTPGREALSGHPQTHRPVGRPHLSLRRPRRHRRRTGARPPQPVGLLEPGSGRRHRALHDRPRRAAAAGLHLLPVSQGPFLRRALSGPGHHRGREHRALREVPHLGGHAVDEARRGLHPAQGGSVASLDRSVGARGPAGRRKDRLLGAVDTALDPPLRRLSRGRDLRSRTHPARGFANAPCVRAPV